MGDFEKFERDLELLVDNLTVRIDEKGAAQLTRLKDSLVDLHRENVVKINHSVMELVCAKYLALKGYDLQVEHKLDEVLTCDLYGVKGYGSLIVEIETGFIPPDHALDPMTYTSARIASKIIRYSNHAGRFALGVPPHYILPFQEALTLPPSDRTKAQVAQVKRLCDRYYQNPPITLEQIRHASIHAIYVIDVDRLGVEEIDPESYIKDRCAVIERS
jgi:hypothetical protein